MLVGVVVELWEFGNTTCEVEMHPGWDACELHP